MSKNLDFSKIYEVVAYLNDYYTETLREGTSLKNSIDEIEEHLSERDSGAEHGKNKGLAAKRLDLVVDSLILTNGKLNDLRESCKRVEELMTSFLCYSLSRFRREKAKTDGSGEPPA
jgi:hypothetical protein